MGRHTAGHDVTVHHGIHSDISGRQNYGDVTDLRCDDVKGRSLVSGDVTVLCNNVTGRHVVCDDVTGCHVAAGTECRASCSTVRVYQTSLPLNSTLLNFVLCVLAHQLLFALRSPPHELLFQVNLNLLLECYPHLSISNMN
jgi:hypothetical protein